MATFRKPLGLPWLPDALYTVVKFKIITSDFHVNILKYRIFVGKVVVNPNFRGWGIQGLPD